MSDTANISDPVAAGTAVPDTGTSSGTAAHAPAAPGSKPTRAQKKQQLQAEQQARQAASEARETRITALAQREMQNLTARNNKLPPSAQDSEKTLWRRARKAAKARLRREAIARKAKEARDAAWARTKNEISGAYHRNETQAAPWIIAAPYLAAGEIANGIAHATGWHPVALSAACAATAAGTSIRVWRAKLAARTPEPFAQKAACGMSLATAWTAAMPFVHGSGQIPMLLAWLCGTGWMGMSWWRQNRHPIPLRKELASFDLGAHVPDAVEGGADEQMDQLVKGILQDWAARADDVIPGAELAFKDTTELAARFEIRLDRAGRITASSIESHKDRLALALGVFVRQITFEPSADRIDVVVMKIARGTAATAYNGPVVLCDGKPISSRWEITPGSTVEIVIGHYLDGDGVATYEVITAGSVNSAFILGSIGSGKTLLAEQIAIALKFLGVELWFVDGQDGASSRLLQTQSDWSVPLTARGVRNLYDAVKGVVAVRSSELKVDDGLGNKYTYDPARPPIIAMMEECQSVFQMEDPETGETYGALFGAIARQQRKNGMGFVVVSQDLDLATTFGGSDILRTCLLAAGNFFGMRLTSSSRGGMLPPDTPDLRAVPKYGYGYKPAGTRPGAMWRATNIEDPRSPKPKLDWIPSFPPSTLDRLARAGAGAAYRNRAEGMAEDNAIVERELEFLRTASDAELDEYELDKQAEAQEEETKKFSTVVTGANGQNLEVFEFNASPLGLSQTSTAPPGPPAPAADDVDALPEEDVRLDRLTDSERGVYDALVEHGPMTATTAKAIAGITRQGDTTITRQGVTKHLKSLVAKGAAGQMDDGRYWPKIPSSASVKG
uniref:hypothetical protein n=1 Tax=Amycolatopsis sp. CA-096443 TaxID=3239919 RepID=UPI003F4918D4